MHIRRDICRKKIFQRLLLWARTFIQSVWKYSQLLSQYVPFQDPSKKQVKNVHKACPRMSVQWWFFPWVLVTKQYGYCDRQNNPEMDFFKVNQKFSCTHVPTYFLFWSFWSIKVKTLEQSFSVKRIEMYKLRDLFKFKQ